MAKDRELSEEEKAQYQVRADKILEFIKLRRITVREAKELLSIDLTPASQSSDPVVAGDAVITAEQASQFTARQLVALSKIGSNVNELKDKFKEDQAFFNLIDQEQKDQEYRYQLIMDAGKQYNAQRPSGLPSVSWNHSIQTAVEEVLSKFGMQYLCDNSSAIISSIAQNIGIALSGVPAGSNSVEFNKKDGSWDKLLQLTERDNPKFKEQEQAVLTNLKQKGNLTRSSESLAMDILAQAVKDIKGKKVTLTEKQEGEIFAKLYPVLSKLDRQYLCDKNQYVEQMLLIALSPKNPGINTPGEFADQDIGLTISYLLANMREQSAEYVNGIVEKGVSEINAIVNEGKIGKQEQEKLVKGFIAEQKLGEESLKNLGFNQEQIDALQSKGMSAKEVDFTDKQLVDVMRLNPDRFKEILGKERGKLSQKHLVEGIGLTDVAKGTKLGEMKSIGDGNQRVIDASKVKALNDRRKAAKMEPVGVKR